MTSPTFMEYDDITHLYGQRQVLYDVFVPHCVDDDVTHLYEI